MHWFKRRRVVVVIWGVHSQDWMEALAPAAPVWKEIPGVQAVLHFSSPEEKVPWRVGLGRRIVMIPLMENHIATRPQRPAALAPTLEALHTLGDKARFADYIREHGLSHLCPITYASIEDAAFPCVIKRTNLNGGAGVELAASLDEARAFLGAAPFVGEAYVIQAMVPCLVEYTVNCVCIKGRILWHKVYAYNWASPEIRRAGSGQPVRRGTLSPELQTNLEAILVPLDYTGPCNVDCTWDEAGCLTVFEINPRFGGSLMRRENTADLAACLSVILEHAGSVK
ncbi:MAG: ATP-grasp domain-containing protein [Verrucomicrobia bacterium]|nr:ATP-grasp domain-containing protein [Verrucomicrobiota bacterium]